MICKFTHGPVSLLSLDNRWLADMLVIVPFSSSFLPTVLILSHATIDTHPVPRDDAAAQQDPNDMKFRSKIHALRASTECVTSTQPYPATALPGLLQAPPSTIASIFGVALATKMARSREQGEALRTRTPPAARRPALLRDFRFRGFDGPIYAV